MPDYDVIIVGAGNAALAASVSARESGADRVLVLEKAGEEMSTQHSACFRKTRIVPKILEDDGRRGGDRPVLARLWAGADGAPVGWFEYANDTAD